MLLNKDELLLHTSKRKRWKKKKKKRKKKKKEIKKRMKINRDIQEEIAVKNFVPCIVIQLCNIKGTAVPLQAWGGPEGSRKLRFSDFMTTAKDGVKVVSFTHRPHLPPGNKLSRPQGP
jgi:hypothetical protein